mmetsp:Transcript_69474/g.148614  ORF Transcript_69474/g.148614 Transcript_69474/m.148614 type:complete len:217 (-) Transcript_69474:821-1471(-)
MTTEVSIIVIMKRIMKIDIIAIIIMKTMTSMAIRSIGGTTIAMTIMSQGGINISTRTGVRRGTEIMAGAHMIGVLMTEVLMTEVLMTEVLMMMTTGGSTMRREGEGMGRTDSWRRGISTRRSSAAWMKRLIASSGCSTRSTRRRNVCWRSVVERSSAVDMPNCIRMTLCLYTSRILTCGRGGTGASSLSQWAWSLLACSSALQSPFWSWSIVTETE